jgi:hypothetical protein
MESRQNDSTDTGNCIAYRFCIQFGSFIFDSWRIFAIDGVGEF